MNVNVEIDITGAERVLQKIADFDVQPVIDTNLVQMLNRARAPGGTPVRTGQLRISSGIAGDEMGYTKEYARKVEIDYERHYLEANVEKQAPLFKEQMEEALKKALEE